MNCKKTATKPMKTNHKTFSYIILILDIVKVLKRRISIGSLLRSSLQLSACKGLYSNSQGQENLLKTFAYENISQINFKKEM